MNYNSKIINKEIVLIIDIVWVCAVAGIGGLNNGAKRNVKADQLRPVPRHNLNKETESNEDTVPRHCTNLLLWVVWPFSNFFPEPCPPLLNFVLVFNNCICNFLNSRFEVGQVLSYKSPDFVRFLLLKFFFVEWLVI